MTRRFCGKDDSLDGYVACLSDAMPAVDEMGEAVVRLTGKRG